MKRKSRLSQPASPEDAELFREAIGDIRRIAIEPGAVERARPPPEPRRLRIDEAEALRESHDLSAGTLPVAAEDLQSFRRANVSERTLKQLKRGEYSVQDEIDLHHLRVADAEILLKRFLNDARAGGSHCVRVVHGKGLRSEGAPVLKMLVDRMLRQRGDVLAFASAPISQGGAGAVLVLLDGR